MSLDVPDIPEVPNPFTNAKVIGDGIDPEAYHRQERPRGDKEFVMTRSELIKFKSCPNRWINGYEPKDSDAKRNGSMVDCYTLDRDRFTNKYAVHPETCTATKTCKAVKDGELNVGDQMPWSPTLKECREWKKDQEAEGREVISPEEIKQCEEAHQRLTSDVILGEFIACSKKQVMIVAEYHDKQTGLVIPCKFLLDLVPDVNHPKFGKDLGDLKTARNAAPHAWAKAVREHGYDVQAAMFRHAYVAATGEDRTDFCHIIQENTFPWQPARRRLSAVYINFGALIYTSSLRDYCQCLATGNWPGYDDAPGGDGWTFVYPEPWMLQQPI